jgi:hypothetical protein
MTLAPGPNLLVADDTSVYWTNVSPTGDALMMMPADGGASSEIASSTGSITGVTLDATNVYWVESAQGGPSAVKKTPLGGGTPSMIASDPHPAQRGLAVSPTTVYWPVAPTCVGAAADMLQAPLSGGTATVFKVGNASSVDFTLDGNTVYWLTGQSCTSGPAAVTECGMVAGSTCAQPIFLTPPGTLRVKTDPSSIYFLAAGAVWVEAKNSLCGTTTLLAAALGITGPSYGFAVDATSVYWTTWGAAPDGSNGTLMQVPLSLSPAKTLASGLAAPKEVAVNNLAVYWVNAGTASEPPALMMLAK